MDPVTAIIILAAHLILSGCLFALVARRLPAQGELASWSMGGLCFGSALIFRLLSEMRGVSFLALPSDALMLLGVLLLTRGMSFLAEREWSLRNVCLAAALLIVLQAAVSSLAEERLRYVVLNLTLGTLYLWLARMSWLPVAQKLCHERQRLPLTLFAVMTLIFGVATYARAAYLAIYGTEFVYIGTSAAAYFMLISLGAVLQGFVLLWNVFERLNGDLADLATHDPLTRMLNRNGLHLALRRHFASREATPMTLLLVDVDDFKSVNDQHGHSNGDTVLIAVSSCLVQACRGSDFVARFGGEEFLVACVASNTEVAHHLAERIRARVAATPLRLSDGRTVRCTVSVGISAEFSQLQEWESASRQADLAMYRAKESGRDRCENWHQSLDRALAV